MKLTFLFLSTFIFFSSRAQINANGAYLMGNMAEIAINNMGYEGTYDLAGSNSRSNQFSPEVYFGFVANPQNNNWTTYNGDFFTPGSAENGFGIEFNGGQYSNNAENMIAPAADIPGTLSNYVVDGECISVDWTGNVAGINMKLRYKFNLNQLYYIIEVTVTNNTASNINNFYFYRNIDPDNNVTLSGIYDTQNTIVSQATASCPISLVSATQTAPYPSYIGLAAVGQNFKVTYGGFSNRSGSDIWNFVGLTGAVAATQYIDDAISLAYKINSFPAGATETFSYAIVLDQAQVSEAFAGLYNLSYASSSGTGTECNPVVDVVELPCNSDSLVVSVTGPNLAGYNWTWSPAAGLSTTTGPTVSILPSTPTTYTVTGTPLTCLSNTIVKEISVSFTGPVILDTTLVAPVCTAFDLSTYTPVDVNNTPGAEFTFHTEEPTGPTDMSNLFSGTTVLPGQTVWVMVSEPTSGCYAVDEINIDFTQDVAGPDSSQTLCMSGLSTIDFDSWLDGATPGGSWEETSSSPSGQFNAGTATLNCAGLDEGIYTFEYATNTVPPCSPEIAVMTVEIVGEPYAGLDTSVTICQNTGETINLNDLLRDNNATGTWSTTQVIPQFNASTGNLSNTGFSAGSYNFNYTIQASAPCSADVATITIVVSTVPIIDPIPDLTTCPGYILPPITGSGLSGNVSYFTGTGGSGSEITPGTAIMETITLYAFDQFGPLGQCMDEEEFTLTIIDVVNVDFVADTLIGCPPLLVTFTNTSTDALFNCTWDFGDGNTFDGCGTAQNSYENVGSYTVTLTGENNVGCIGSETKTNYIVLIAYPEAEFSMNPHFLDMYHTDISLTDESIDAVTYSWSLGDGTFSTDQNLSHTYPEAGGVAYPIQLVVENYLGCVDTVMKYIFVNEVLTFFVPNTFTPDGDEFNNSFKPVIAAGVDLTTYHLTIFDRWGEILFESHDVNVGWDGTYNGSLVKDGTYIWTISFKEKNNDDKHEFEGHVNMIR